MNKNNYIGVFFVGFLGFLGVFLMAYSYVQKYKAAQELAEIKKAQDSNTSKMCKTKGACNAVTPATWENDEKVARKFYTPKKEGEKGGEWNHNTGPSKDSDKLPLSWNKIISESNWKNLIAAVESANNLGYAQGTLKERVGANHLLRLLGGGLLSLSICFALIILLEKQN